MLYKLEQNGGSYIFLFFFFPSARPLKASLFTKMKTTSMIFIYLEILILLIEQCEFDLKCVQSIITKWKKLGDTNYIEALLASNLLKY